MQKGPAGPKRIPMKIIKKQSSQNSISRVAEVLDVLYQFADWSASSYWYRGKSYEDILRIRGAQRRKDFQVTLKYLKQKKLIEVKKTATQVMISLTQNGRLRALREHISRYKKILPKGETCMVIFDIPEQARAVRKTFRMFLKESGFLMVQGSVWESSYDVFDVLAEFVHRLGLQDWVDIVHAERRMHGMRKGPAGPNRIPSKLRKF